MPNEEADRREMEAMRVRKVADEVFAENLARFWDRLGINIRESAGIEKAQRCLNGLALVGIRIHDEASLQRSEKVVEWMFGQFDRSETQTRRLLAWISIASGVVVIVGGFIGWWSEWHGLKP